MNELEQVYTGKNNESVITALFGWWFFDLPRKIIFITTSYITKLLRFFSMGLLFKTLFSPWRRDIVNIQGIPLQSKIQVWVMNIISRLIGLIIRLITILFGLIYIIVVFILFGLFLLIMLLMPLFIIIIIILSL